VRAVEGGPFAAVVVKDGEIIAEGANCVTTTNDPTAHAEIVAIRQACKALNDFQLTGCDIYTTCEPCPMCMAAIYWSRADRVFYASTAKDAARFGFDDHFIYEQLQLPANARKLPMTQMMRQEALEPFAVWEKSPEKVDY
jgi:tRNA(Arg) A34 adenosine deaminase TadA